MGAFRCATACLLLLGLPAAAMADHHDSLMQEVAAIGERIQKAMMEDDVDTMLSMYTEDAISLPNYGPRMDGIEAFKRHHDEMAESGMKILSFESQPTDVWECGDQVIEIGTYEIELDTPEMSGIQDRGKYLTVYVRDAEGNLKIKAETWNTDVNPMEMMGMGPPGEHEDGHDHDDGE